MAETTKGAPRQQDTRKAAIISGVVNAAINGAIQAHFLWGQTSVPCLSMRSARGTHTVLGSAVPLAVSLAMILTAVAHWTLEGPKKPFVPTTLWLIVKHGLFAFGAVVAAAVVWQRVAGTVDVSVATAVLLLAAVAGIVAGLGNYMTISEVVERDS